MLSRIAEAMYWVGRYSERAEDTARLMDVHYHALAESSGTDELQSGQALLEMFGLGDSQVEPGAYQLAEMIGYDSEEPPSIARAVQGAWENARGVRETISVEMWECLNSTYQGLDQRAREAGGPVQHNYYQWIRDRMVQLSGVTDATLTRDEGWQFFILGKHMERADLTARLLGSGYGDAWGDSGWRRVLQCTGAYEGYMRSYHSDVDRDTVMEFLVLDQLFPRSVISALMVAERCLYNLDPSFQRLGTEDEARRSLAALCARLEYSPVNDYKLEFTNSVSDIEETLSEVHSLVTDRYFASTTAIVWSS